MYVRRKAKAKYSTSKDFEQREKYINIERKIKIIIGKKMIKIEHERIIKFLASTTSETFISINIFFFCFF